MSKKYARYLKASILDAGSDKSAVNEQYTPALIDHINNGTVPKDVVLALFKGEADDTRAIEVAVFRHVYNGRSDHGATKDRFKKSIACIIINANIDRNGVLSYAGKRPLIPRDILEPSENARGATVGDLSDMDDFLSSELLPERSSWKNVIDYADRLFKAVCDIDADDRAAETVHGFIRKGASSDGMTKNVVSLYDAIIDSKIVLPLFDAFATKRQPALPLLHGHTGWVAHSGNINGDHPLALAQRHAVHHFLSLRDGETLAVNGPPGTGKTTFLQAAIASLFVNSVLTDQRPPVIVACAATNTAITNIIDSFKSEQGDRWLPDLPSYGMYLYDKVSDYIQQDAVEKTMETEDYIRKAETYFLTRYNDHFKSHTVTSLGEAMSALHLSIRKDVDHLQLLDDKFKPMIEGGISIEMLNEKLRNITGCKAEIDDTEDRQRLIRGSLTSLKLLALKKKSDSVQFLLAESASEDIHRNIAENTAAMNVLKKLRSELIAFQARQSIFHFIPFMKKKSFGSLWELSGRYGFDLGEINWQSFGVEDALLLVDAKIKTINKQQNDLCMLAGEKNSELANILERESLAELVEIAGRHRIIPSDRGHLFAEIKSVATELDTRSAALEVHAKKLGDSIVRATADHKRGSEILADCNHTLAQFGASDFDDLVGKLDKSKYASFNKAAHFYEAAWMIEVKNTILSGDVDKKSVSKQERRWRRHAKLFPCMVSTFHSLPKWFAAGHMDGHGTWIPEPLFNFIDLLIVDEAGQAAPDIASAAFSLSKKALVVGDTLQIEPIWNVCEEIDVGNLVDAGVIAHRDELENYALTGRTASSGSIMAIAQTISPYHYDTKMERGMYLYEHRRCTDNIIQFCNDLCYKGVLKPARGKRNELSPLPEWGFGHVKGLSAKLGGWSNDEEAESIREFIERHQPSLEKFYGKKIGDIVAVITPYKKQSDLLKAKLTAFDCIVGTVHVMQGQERPVIIMSTVLSADPSGKKKTSFLDQKKNMLNVAVSRAKDSFIVIGDMDALDDESHAPSGVLARYLFRGEALQVRQPVIADLKPTSELDILRTAEQHDSFMLEAIRSAKRIVWIVSPWITDSMFQYSDEIVKAIESARGNGIELHVFTDMEKTEGKKHEVALATLSRLGCQVHSIKHVHAKQIFVDDDLFCYGSFNWLSAIRTGKYADINTSIVIRNPTLANREKSLMRDVYAKKYIRPS